MTYPEMRLWCRRCNVYWSMRYEFDEGPFGDLLPVPASGGIAGAPDSDECPVCHGPGERQGENEKTYWYCGDPRCGICHERGLVPEGGQ